MILRSYVGINYALCTFRQCPGTILCNFNAGSDPEKLYFVNFRILVHPSAINNLRGTVNYSYLDRIYDNRERKDLKRNAVRPYETMNDHLPQLAAVLEVSIIQIDQNNPDDVFSDAKQLLSQNSECCIVVPTTKQSNKLKSFNNLYRCTSLLRRIRRRLCIDDPSLKVVLIGVYPSLDYPACVYEMNTSADRYVSSNILPNTGSALTRAIKEFITKLLGANPAVGGLGLLLYKE